MSPSLDPLLSLDKRNKGLIYKTLSRLLTKPLLSVKETGISGPGDDKPEGRSPAPVLKKQSRGDGKRPHHFNFDSLAGVGMKRDSLGSSILRRGLGNLGLSRWSGVGVLRNWAGGRLNGSVG